MANAVRRSLHLLSGRRYRFIGGMNLQPRPPDGGGRILRPPGRRAFTLIELLTVIAIIAILASIAFGVMSGVKKRAAAQHARADLAVLAQALEDYKRQYGDYPQTVTTAAQLNQALLGKLGPTGQAMAGRTLIDSAKFDLSDPANPAAASTSLLDPWDQPYRYLYFQDVARTGYVLFSIGADGRATNPTNLTTLNEATDDNLDNIYANR